MSIRISDPEFEQQVDAERRRRGHKTMAKTLRDIARERFMQLSMERPSTTATGNQPIGSNDARHPANAVA
jgi:hypothetical protein